MKKENKIVVVSDEQEDSYLAQGWETIGKDGRVLNRSTGGKNIKVQEYNAALDDLEKEREEKASLKKELEATKRELKKLQDDVAAEKETKKDAKK